ncbi:MAG: (Fe-S)-binding protein [Candidatus Thorarchaeota archaeon]
MERLEKYEDWARACMHVRCGFCRDNCPVYSQLELDSYAAKGKITMLYHMLKGSLQPDDVVAERVFACTNCGLCDVACGYNQSEAIQEMKAVLFDSAVEPPEGYLKISNKTRESGNPYAADEDEGSRFLHSIPESKLSSAEYTLFLGCTQIYRDQEGINTLLQVLRTANVSFRILTTPICCGSPAYRVGDTSQARNQAERVANLFETSGSDKILISCAGCYRMIAHDYQNLLNEPPSFSIHHITELLQDIMKTRKLKLLPLDKTLTYHDPCHLGRHSGIFEEPRDVLDSIPGTKLIEMEWNRKFAKCCGAGGGFRSGRSDDAIDIAAKRVRDAEDVKASMLVTSCPFCLRNLQDGAKRINSSIEVVSIESLIESLLDT